MFSRTAWQKFFVCLQVLEDFLRMMNDLESIRNLKWFASPQTMESCRVTLMSVLSLTAFLRSRGASYAVCAYITASLNQDPLEAIWLLYIDMGLYKQHFFFLLQRFCNRITFAGLEGPSTRQRLPRTSQQVPASQQVPDHIWSIENSCICKMASSFTATR